MTLRIADAVGLSDVGRHRQANEDSYVVSPPLFAVADGMGGARAGEVASRLAVEALQAGITADEIAERRLGEIVRAANRRIWDLARQDESHAGMGTTLTAAMLDHDEVVTGHVGDSRLYRYRDGRMERLTTDHSLVEELVRQGKLTPEGAERHPQKSIITRALGPEPDVEVETFTAPARDGDVYLICSDGLTGMVSEAHIAEILRGGGPLRDAAHALVDAANEGGGRDNITVVLFRLEAGATRAAEADTLSGLEDGLRGEEVRSALTAPTREAPLSADPDTMVLSPEVAREAREPPPAAGEARAAPAAREATQAVPLPAEKRATPPARKESATPPAGDEHEAAPPPGEQRVAPPPGDEHEAAPPPGKERAAPPAGDERGAAPPPTEVQRAAPPPTEEQRAAPPPGKERAAPPAADEREAAAPAATPHEAVRPPPREEPRGRAARPRPRHRPARRARGAARGLRRGLGVVVALVVAVGVLIALWQAGRQVYFVGTEEHGLVALYRGLPYEGPFGISLYEQVAVTSVPARTIGAERRERILDHELRSREDAVDLVVQLEQGRIP